MGIITQNALMASDFVIIPTDGNRGGHDGLVHLILVFYREIRGRPAGGTMVLDGRPVAGSVFAVIEIYWKSMH